MWIIHQMLINLYLQQCKQHLIKQQDTITLQTPLNWALDLANPDKLTVALDIGGDYTMGSLIVSNNTTVFGDLYIGS